MPFIEEFSALKIVTRLAGKIKFIFLCVFYRKDSHYFMNFLAIRIGCVIIYIKKTHCRAISTRFGNFCEA
jgi:hypothetical protein